MPYESTLKMKKRWWGGNYGPPQKWKKYIFSILGGPVISSLHLFLQFEGTFIRQTFRVEKDPAKHMERKWKVCFIIVCSDLLKNSLIKSNSDSKFLSTKIFGGISPRRKPKNTLRYFQKTYYLDTYYYHTMLFI